MGKSNLNIQVVTSKKNSWEYFPQMGYVYFIFSKRICRAHYMKAYWGIIYVNLKEYTMEILRY